MDGSGDSSHYKEMRTFSIYNLSRDVRGDSGTSGDFIRRAYFVVRGFRCVMRGGSGGGCGHRCSGRCSAGLRVGLRLVGGGVARSIPDVINDAEQNEEGCKTEADPRKPFDSLQDSANFVATTAPLEPKPLVLSMRNGDVKNAASAPVR